MKILFKYIFLLIVMLPSELKADIGFRKEDPVIFDESFGDLSNDSWKVKKTINVGYGAPYKKVGDTTYRSVRVVLEKNGIIASCIVLQYDGIGESVCGLGLFDFKKSFKSKKYKYKREEIGKHLFELFEDGWLSESIESDDRADGIRITLVKSGKSVICRVLPWLNNRNDSGYVYSSCFEVVFYK